MAHIHRTPPPPPPRHDTVCLFANKPPPPPSLLNHPKHSLCTNTTQLGLDKNLKSSQEKIINLFNHFSVSEICRHKETGHATQYAAPPLGDERPHPGLHTRARAPVTSPAKKMLTAASCAGRSGEQMTPRRTNLFRGVMSPTPWGALNPRPYPVSPPTC